MPFAFEFKRITKRFGDVIANREVSFGVERGSIHGVVGENGAGKSTIMKILYGLYQPDAGEIYLNERLKKLPSPQAAIALGIGMVHQHFMLVPTLTVWENVVLGSEPTLLKLSKNKITQDLDTLQKSFGMSLDLNAIVETLSVGQQQQVEILKLLYRKADILILDEPTAVLTPQEVDHLFERLKTLKTQNKTIVLITHKLKEILKLTENVTIMRQGTVVETVPTSALTESLLAEKIIGRKQVTLPARKQFEDERVVLELKDLTLRKKQKTLLNHISFSIKRGEILGIAGIEGNGQHELVEVVSNVDRSYEGSLLFLNVPLKEELTYFAKQRGLSVIPPDRHHEGLILDFDVEENSILGHHLEINFANGIRTRTQRVKAHARKLMDQFDVRPRDPKLPLSGFSGGNQQKIVVARETGGKVNLLVAAHPTRGVDIGAIEFIHSHILQLRDEGAGVLLISSELDEVLALSDRILVMYQGKIAGEILRKEASETQLGLWMTGGQA